MAIPTTPVWTIPSSAGISVMDYGAVGNGVADDTAAINAGIAAAVAAGKWLYLPAGTFKVTSTIVLPSYARLHGHSEAATKLIMGTKAVTTALLNGNDKTGLVLQDMSLDGTVWTNLVISLQATGATNCTVRNVTALNSQYGLKLGSGNPGSNWLFEDVHLTNCRMGAYVEDVSDSIFRRITGTCPSNDTHDHVFYIEKDNHNILFEDLDLSLTAAGGYCINMYKTSGTSDYLTFNRVNCDVGALGLRSIHVGTYSNVTITDLVCNGSDYCMVLGGDAVDLLVDGITATGASAAFWAWGAGAQTNVTFQNGTFAGPRLAYASSESHVTNLTYTNFTLI